MYLYVTAHSSDTDIVQLSGLISMTQSTGTFAVPQAATNPLAFPLSFSVVQLPSNASGKLDLMLSGLDAQGNPIATGNGEIIALAPGRNDLDIVLGQVGNDMALPDASDLSVVPDAGDAAVAMDLSSVDSTSSDGASSLIVEDTFQRPDQTGWGNASDGLPWSVGTHFSIASNLGVITGGGTATIGPNLMDSQITFEGMTSTGESFGPILRWNASNDSGYMAALGGGNFQIQRVTNGSTTALATTAATITTNTQYMIRFKVTSQQLQAKFWPASQLEPSTWLTTTDPSSTPYTMGLCGVRSTTGPTGVISIKYFNVAP